MKRILSKKNGMLKLIVLMMVLSMTMTSFAACGGGGEEAPAENSDTITITDHADRQVEVPKDIQRIAVCDIYPLPSVLAVFFDSADKIVGMLSGQVDMMPGAYINCKDYLASGQFAALGVPSAERYELIKDIPTFKEQGIDLVYPDCDFSFYFPKETPDEVITWYENIVKEMHSRPEAVEAIRKVEMMPYYLSAADSEKHDAEYFNTFKSIADELAK